MPDGLRRRGSGYRIRCSTDDVALWAGSSVPIFGVVYDPERDGPIRHQATEVADGWWMTLADLQVRLADPDWPFVPDGRFGFGAPFDDFIVSGAINDRPLHASVPAN